SPRRPPLKPRRSDPGPSRSGSQPQEYRRAATRDSAAGPRPAAASLGTYRRLRPSYCQIVPGILRRVATQRIDTPERRARLARRHNLAPSGRAASPVQAARSLVPPHATAPATVYLSAAARVKRPSIADIEAALYVERALVRMLGMRRTVFVVPVELAGIVQASSTRA